MSGEATAVLNKRELFRYDSCDRKKIWVESTRLQEKNLVYSLRKCPINEGETGIVQKDVRHKKIKENLDGMELYNPKHKVRE